MIKPDKNIVFYFISLIFGVVTEIRNSLFNAGILKSKSFDIPIISIGNIAVGGTGKTPHVEFLIKLLSSKKYKTAILSRGYKRETNGYISATSGSSAKTIGDEPFQIFSKFPDTVVAVDEKRVHGVTNLLQNFPEIEVILLDDAFQHRYIKPGLSVLLTDYSNLYTEDHLLPYGKLREKAKNSKRADIVIVTKCPLDIQEDKCKLIAEKLKLESYQEIYFSGFEYGSIYPVFPQLNFSAFPEITNQTAVLLLTGIEKPEPMLEWLKKATPIIKTRFYPDHHDFTENDIVSIEKDFSSLQGEKIILTTEKDAARLKSNIHLKDEIKKNIYALPLEIRILNNEQNKFIQKIQNYVGKNSRNC